MEQGRELRCGFTTGTAVAAAALAVLRQCRTVEVELPKHEKLLIPVHRLAAGSASVLKDAGDDPDVTHGAEIQVALRPAELSEARPEDYVEPCGDGGTLIVRGGQGVGLATRPGLAVPPGKWAVNPGPRRILKQNLSDLKGVWLLVITVPDGEKLAEQTLNPKLGIVGGISILGNSGIVRPYSNAAYAASVALQLRSIAASGGREVVLSTGNRTAEAAERDWPGIPVVRIGDFIKASLLAARKAGVERVLVACMPGKLFKYACGYENTHAHKVEMNLEELLPGTGDFKSMGELAAGLPDDRYRDILKRLEALAAGQLGRWHGGVEIILYNAQGERLI
jgi:cobalt-precorrin-5B (C1)-methyltransferase